MNTTNADYFTFNVNNSMLLVGQTGSGKTFLVKKLLYTLESAFTPDQMKFALFDMKNVEFVNEGTDDDRSYSHEYLLFDVVLDPIKGLDKLDELAKLAKNRAKLNKPVPLIFIYIEECDMTVFDKERFDHALITINENARDANMKLIYATSRPGEAAISKRLLHSFELILAGPLADMLDYDYLEVPQVTDLKPYDFAITER